jgi:glutathione S-transferase
VKIPKAIRHQLDVLGSVATSTLAAWRGTSVVTAAKQPAKRLKLYDQEGCPHCRDVREALTALGLNAEIFPCPKGGSRYVARATEITGTFQLPLLVDANTGAKLQDSQAIVDYLFKTYGDHATPAAYQRSAVRPLIGAAASAVRGLRGTTSRPSIRPKKKLILWSFESSPYSRLVRERLTELEIAYVLHNIGKEQLSDMGPAVRRIKPGPYRPVKGGLREKVLRERGRVQVPYLEDPNTGAKLYESSAIIDYLESYYAG